MDRDLRETPLYKEVEEYYRKSFEPVFGKIFGPDDVDPSPDGRRVAFTGSKLEKLEGTPALRICVADVDGNGSFREITAGPNNDRSPRWSPDGRRLAFLSDRAKAGSFQLFVLDQDSLGEAAAAPAVEGTGEYLSWSPDGRRVLVAAAGAGADLPAVQGSGTTKEDDADLPAWMPTVDAGDGENAWRRLWLFDTTSNTTTPGSREGLNVWEAVWAGPDRILAIVSDDPSENAWYHASLALIDTDGGKERLLYKGDRQLGWPAASPDGSRLAVVQAICSDRLVVAGDLLLIDPESGESQSVDTNGVDVTSLAWLDADRLFWLGQRDLDMVAGEFDASSSAVTELWSSNESSGIIQPDGRPTADGGCAAVFTSFDRYPEVVIAARDGSVRTVASFVHEGSTYRRDMAGRIERVSWTASDGLEIQGLLVRPAEGDGPFPLIVNVHGGPIGATSEQWSMRSTSLPLLVSRGYAMLFPNPRGSSGRGQAFAEMVYGDMGGGDAADIMAGVDALIERGVADGSRLGVTGGSYGGFMSAWLVTQTDRFGASVAISPVTDWYSQHFASNIGTWDRDILRDEPAKPGGEYFARSPVMFASNVRTPTLLTAGSVDECTPPGQAHEFYRALRENGVEAALAIYPGEGHGVRNVAASVDLTTRMLWWFERYIPATTERE
ncbi:MAG TPA: S9 family peptidase [Actinobacteria bacterium]|nr:S9 family peptidase [Actinomycetota bacterium]